MYLFIYFFLFIYLFIFYFVFIFYFLFIYFLFVFIYFYFFLIDGKKRWTLYPPTIVPPGVEIDEYGEIYGEMHPLEWFLEIYPHLEEGERPFEVQQEPGDIIFVPGGKQYFIFIFIFYFLFFIFYFYFYFYF